MAADTGMDTCPSPEITDSRKRPLDGDSENGDVKRSHFSSAVEPTYHFKVLVPSMVAGAIIGKGGETIAQLQKDTGARVKMSKSHDFYPGTTERACLITGSVDGIMVVLDFIMDKIKEKPELVKPFPEGVDTKMPQDRDKQVKILVPNSTAGMIIGKGGNYIKQIKETSGSYVQISQKAKELSLQERCITVVGEKDGNKKACLMILQKVVDDPQSGSCPNVSYADVAGPVANYNPTGSPYAVASEVTEGHSLGGSVGGVGGVGSVLVNGAAAPLTQHTLDHIKVSDRFKRTREYENVHAETSRVLAGRVSANIQQNDNMEVLYDQKVKTDNTQARQNITSKAALLKSYIKIKKRATEMMEKEHNLKMKYHQQELAHQKLRHQLEVDLYLLDKEKKLLEIELLKKKLNKE